MRSRSSSFITQREGTSIGSRLRAVRLGRARCGAAFHRHDRIVNPSQGLPFVGDLLRLIFGENVRGGNRLSGDLRESNRKAEGAPLSFVDGEEVRAIDGIELSAK